MYALIGPQKSFKTFLLANEKFKPRGFTEI
jgi:hypothetical protein